MVKGIIVGTLIIGFLSGIPFISAGNICCCLWVVIGGAVAALLARGPEGLSAGRGFLAGGISGILGAILATLISLPFQLLFGTTNSYAAAIQQMPPEAQASIPPELWSILAGGGGMVIMAFVSCLIMMVIFAIFGGLGGVITALIKK